MGALRSALLALAVAAGGGVHAQTVTLDWVARMAAQFADERGAAQARLAERGAAGALQAAQGVFDWQAGGSAGVRRGPEYLSAGGFLTTATEDRTTVAGAVHVERLFESGIRIQPGVATSRGEAGTTRLLGRSNTQAMLQLDIPLDRSLGSPPEKLRLEQARIEWQQAGREVERARQAHVHQALRVALALLAAQEQHELAREALTEAVAAHEVVSRLVQRGEMAQSALVQASARKAMRETEVERLKARERALGRELSAAVQARSAGGPQALRILGPWPVMPRMGSLEGLEQRARDSRPELARARHEVEAAQVKARLADVQGGSRLNLSVRQDGAQISWAVPLGAGRSAGLKQQATAAVDAATDRQIEAEAAILRELRDAWDRAHSAQADVARLAPVRDDLGRLKRSLAGSGAAQMAQSTEVEEQYLRVAQQLSERQWQLATALNDLAHLTGQLPAAPAVTGERR